MSFEVKTVERTGAHLLIQLSGVSGGGKTYSALQLAYGLAGGDASKVVGIDTENRRMALNADILPGGARFKIIEFFAPFSPDRYIEAIDAACHAGAEVIVIDSVSHEWESEGGCEWIANQTRFPDWRTAKSKHKRFMTHMLQCPAHIIVCSRAREKVDFTDPKNPKSLGIQPITEKNFSFEATVSLMMQDQGRKQDVLKCPADLQAILGRGNGYITADDGAALRAWVQGGVQVDPETEKTRGMLQNITEQGMAALQAAWQGLPAGTRKKISPDGRCPDDLKASAQAFDKMRETAQPGGAELEDLNSQVLGKAENAEAIPNGG